MTKKDPKEWRFSIFKNRRVLALLLEIDYDRWIVRFNTLFTKYNKRLEEEEKRMLVDIILEFSYNDMN